jgi:hypothetical protein
MVARWRSVEVNIDEFVFEVVRFFAAWIGMRDWNFLLLFGLLKDDSCCFWKGEKERGQKRGKEREWEEEGKRRNNKEEGVLVLGQWNMFMATLRIVEMPV